MENVSKALLIAGAIVLAILIIGAGMYAFNKSSTTVESTMETLSIQEKEAFNSQFMMYDGKVTGADVKSLIGTLISNSASYEDQLSKVPSVVIDTKVATESEKIEDATRPTSPNKMQDYVDQLTIIRNAVDKKHKYTIEMNYDETGLVGEIKLIY